MDYSVCKACNRSFKCIYIEPTLIDCGHIICWTCFLDLKESKCPHCQGEFSFESYISVSSKVVNVLCTKGSIPYFVFRPYVELEQSLRKMKGQLSLYASQYNHLTNIHSILEKTMENTHENNISKLLKVVNNLKMVLKSIGNFLSTGASFRITNELRNFNRKEDFIQSLISRLDRDEELYTAYRVGYEIKYGKLFVDCNWSYRLFIHSLTETEVREGVDIISFQNIKDCIDGSNLLTFIDIPDDDDDPKNSFNRYVFTMEASALATQFIKICSGECGKTYKGISFSTLGDFEDVNKTLLSVNGYMCNGSFERKPIDYNFDLYVEPGFIKHLYIPDRTLNNNDKFSGDTTNTLCWLLQASENGSFKLLCNIATKRFKNIIGIASVESLSTNMETRILDCGIAVAIEQYDMYKIVRSDLYNLPYTDMFINKR